MQKNVSPGLDFIPSGGVAGFTLSLLYSNRLRELIATLKGRYDKIIFDSPPIIGVSDASVLISTVDGAVLLIQHRRNPQSMVLRAQQIVESLKTTLADPAYAKLELLDVVYGNDESEESYNQALALVDKYPDLGLIMSPTTVGIQATAKAMQDEGLCDKVKVSGLGLPSEMASYTMNGCAPEFALWDFRDLGYLTYYTAYGLATGQLKGDVGETFKAGRMGEYKIEEDPGRKGAKRILMGPFTIYTKDNVEAAAK